MRAPHLGLAKCIYYFQNPQWNAHEISYYIATSGERRKERNKSGQRANKLYTSYKYILVLVAENNSVVKPKYQQYTSLYLAKHTVNISALQHHCFLKLQLICLYMKYEMFPCWALVFRSFVLTPLVARAVVAVVTPARNALDEQRGREERGILVAHVL